MSGFEGSFLGDSGRIKAATAMECGVCWWVYDPAQGDKVWQIAAGTPFTELPSHWRCPNCDAAPNQFMALQVLANEQSVEGANQTSNSTDEELAHHCHRLERAYREVDKHMRSLPVHNPNLNIHIVGMRRCEYGYLSVSATPWCMNLVLLPEEGGRVGREGTSRELTFPSGTYAFTSGHLPGVGDLETCSLFSPMNQFEDPAAVQAVAEHAIAGLLTPADKQNVDKPIREHPLRRRQFLRPGASP